MTLFDGFWYVFVCGTMMTLIIMYLLMETSPQVRRVNKRGAEENDDKSSWEGEFEWKRIQVGQLSTEITQDKNFRDKKCRPQNKNKKNVCIAAEAATIQM